MKLLYCATLAIVFLPSLSIADQIEELRGKQFRAKDTLRAIDEPSDDARKCLEGLVWSPAEFTVTCQASNERRGDLLVRFPSPVDSADAVNDLVAMEWYAARDDSLQPIKAKAIVVVHESNREMVVGRLLARSLRGMGLHAFLLHMPNYGERRAGGRATASGLLQHAVQAVADVRRARDAVAALPLVDSEHIALQGTSLGGFVSATSASLDGGYDSVFLLLAGGDLYDIIQHGERDAAKAREALAASGLAGDKLKDVLYRIEPTRIAHRLDASRTWLYSGEQDTVVPLKNALALATAAKLEDGHHIRLKANHYSGIIYLPSVLDHMVKQICGEASGARFDK